MPQRRLAATGSARYAGVQRRVSRTNAASARQERRRSYSASEPLRFAARERAPTLRCWSAASMTRYARSHSRRRRRHNRSAPAMPARVPAPSGGCCTSSPSTPPTQATLTRSRPVQCGARSVDLHGTLSHWKRARQPRARGEWRALGGTSSGSGGARASGEMHRPYSTLAPAPPRVRARVFVCVCVCARARARACSRGAGAAPSGRRARAPMPSWALPVDEVGAVLVVLCLAHPHLLEGAERGEDGAAHP